MTGSESGEKRKSMSENKFMGINKTQEKNFPVKNKALAVLGSPGSGKTTTSIKLALELAKHKKNAVVVFCDPFTSVLPYVIPAGTAVETSLGTLLTAPGITQTDILEACVPVGQTEYVSYLGYRAGENLMAYPKVTRDKAVDFFVMLRHLADFVIIDCSTIFEADPVSIVGIETADTALRLGTSNLKGIAYYQTHMPMLADSVFHVDKHYKAISMLKPWQEWEAVSQQYGGVKYTLPYVTELEQQYDEVSLPDLLKSRESLKYTAEIKRIVGDVFGIGDNPADAGQKAAQKVRQSEDSRKTTRGAISFKLPFGKSKGEF